MENSSAYVSFLPHDSEVLGRERVILLCGVFLLIAILSIFLLSINEGMMCWRFVGSISFVKGEKLVDRSHLFVHEWLTGWHTIFLVYFLGVKELCPCGAFGLSLASWCFFLFICSSSTAPPNNAWLVRRSGIYRRWLIAFALVKFLLYGVLFPIWITKQTKSSQPSKSNALNPLFFIQLSNCLVTLIKVILLNCRHQTIEINK